DPPTAPLLPNRPLDAVRVAVRGTVRGVAAAEPSEPATGLWTATGSMTSPRCGLTATLLPNGQVLVAGGEDGDDVLASAELYDPGSGLWTATGSMTSPRYEPTATLLPNGQVLVAGGQDADALASAELYDPANGRWTATG